DGLQTELARSIASLSEQDCKQLGSAPFTSGDVFSWLGALDPRAPRRLLIVLDQVDDYVLAHQQHFMKGRTVIELEDLETKSPDWEQLAQLVRSDRVHLLIACRNDVGALEALRLAKSKTYLLTRVNRQSVSQLLDEIVREDAQRPVVADPEFGWSQLKN